MPLGQDILTLAPEAALIIQNELGITQQDIANLTADDSGPFQGPDAQLDVTVATTQQGAALPQTQIREIWLGNHSVLGPLQARLPVWNAAYANLRKRQVAAALVPEFFQAITEDINGVRRVTHRGALDPADPWPRGHLVDNLTHIYDGLAWPDAGAPGQGFFVKVCELAAATLYHHADVFSMGAQHCALLRARHAVRYLVHVDASCGGVEVNEDYQFFTPACPFPQMQGTDSICW
jgi:hypothetical protein